MENFDISMTEDVSPKKQMKLDVSMTEEVSPRKLMKRKAESTNQETTTTEVQTKEAPREKRRKVLAEIRPTYPPRLTAPVVWSVDAEVDGRSIYADSEQCIVGTNDGRVIYLDRDGDVIKQMRLRPQVGAIMKDGQFMYAWCHPKNDFQRWNGCLYDITGAVPRLLFDVEDFGEWVTLATVFNGCLVLGDNSGGLALFGLDGTLFWHKKQSEGSGGYMGVDSTGVYFVHKKRVCKYKLENGSLLWQYEVAGGLHGHINSGAMDDSHVYAEANGQVIQLDKSEGNLIREFVPVRHRASGICLGNDYLVTGFSPTVIFDVGTGAELYRMNFSGRLEKSVSVMLKSGQMFTFWDKIYCVDLAPEAILRALEGKSRPTKEKVANFDDCIRETVELEKVEDAGDGVQLLCNHVDGKLRVRVISDGYFSTWNVAFPAYSLYPGTKYVVDKLEECKLGSFYRMCGIPKEVVTKMEENEEKPDSAPEKKNDKTDKSPKNIKQKEKIITPTIYKSNGDAKDDGVSAKTDDVSTETDDVTKTD